MKTADIIADGETEYVYAESYEWNSRYGGQKGHHVVVLAKKVERKVWATYGGRHAVHDGVTIQFLDGSRKGETKTVRSAEVRERWDVWKPAHDEAMKAKKEREDAQRVAFEALSERVKSSLPTSMHKELPFEAVTFRSSGDPLLRINLKEFADLLDAAYLEGAADERARLGIKA